MLFRLLLLFSVLSAYFLPFAQGKEVCCETTGCYSNDAPFKHLPLPHCEKKINARFFMYTVNNPVDAEEMTTTSIPSLFSSDRETVFIIHGYSSSATVDWMLAMRTAYLQQGDYNVVLVGWKKGAGSYYYPQSASNTRVVGAVIANMADILVQRGLSRSKISCVGHSLGSHTCGFFGARSKIERITGLDPAGPKFGAYPPEVRLSPDDANFVDAIHTMGKEGLIMDFGTLVPMGHVDFYPNGGGVQPGCSNYKLTYNERDDVMNSHDTDRYGDGLACSHSRAILYYIESLLNPCFDATHICTDYKKIPASCSPCNNCQQMGFSAKFYDKKGLILLNTNSAMPFCQGA